MDHASSHVGRGMFDSFDCHSKYGLIDNDSSPSVTTILSTIILILLTLLIEITAAVGNGKSASGTSASANPPIIETHSRAFRKRRFVTATFLIVMISIAFGIRIKETQIVYPLKCRVAVNIAPVQWWAVTLFAIIPFTCACFAWLRTLVDCVLVRWDTRLAREHWPPFAPISFVVIAIRTVLLKTVDLVMGSEKKIQDVEMNAVAATEEERGLMRGVDGGENQEDDEITVYSPRGSFEAHTGSVDKA